ncbi:MAG: SDR family oxidoreductase [Bacteroidota bacterium]
MFSLTDQISLVSGAASGIGLAIAEAFAHQGSLVYLADINDEAGLQEASKLRDAGYQAEYLHVDVVDEASCQKAAQHLHQQHGKLDILVNNAGIGGVGTMISTSGETLDQMMAVNVRGVFNLSKAFLPDMLKRKQGNIINMASIGGLVGLTDRLAYCATKFAVVGMTKCMALDHAKDGVRINAICPGRVETPFVKARIQEYPDPEKAYQDMSASQPMGRMASPQEVAAAAIYLASNASSFVTGAMQVVDGGWSAT